MDRDSNQIQAVLHEMQKDLRRETGEIVDAVNRLVKALEYDDRRRECDDERAEERAERDHDKLIEAIGTLAQHVENNGKSLRELPERILQVIEKEIYKLRTARYEAQQALNEPLPLPPANYREPTGQHVALARTDVEEHTKPFARHHVDGEKRTVDEWIGGAVLWGVKKGWPWAVTALSGGGLVELLHKLRVW